MKQNKTTYNDLPEKIDVILSELAEIKEALVTIQRPEEVPKLLSIDSAVAYLKQYGITISKSTLYKRSSSGLLPSLKIENRLYFSPRNLIEIITYKNERR